MRNSFKLLGGQAVNVKKFENKSDTGIIRMIRQITIEILELTPTLSLSLTELSHPLCPPTLQDLACPANFLWFWLQQNAAARASAEVAARAGFCQRLKVAHVVVVLWWAKCGCIFRTLLYKLTRTLQHHHFACPNRIETAAPETWRCKRSHPET